MKTLDEVKQYLKDTYNINDNTNKLGLIPDLYDSIREFILTNPEFVKDIASKISNGVDFHKYFEDEDEFEKLIILKEQNPSLFFDIIRKEELFLNYIAWSSGCEGVIIHFNVDTLFDDLGE